MVIKVSEPSTSRSNRRKKYAQRKCEKEVPNMVLGITVTTPLKGMEGTLDWLKDVRIHKYWAFFSHLTYSEMVSIGEDNIEFLLGFHGATEKIPEGAKNKIIKSITELRERSDKLKKINPAEVEESCTIISSILKTPLSEIHLEKDGTDLTGLLEHKIRIVVETSMKLREGDEFIKSLLEEYAEHPSTKKDDKKSAEAWLDSIKTKTFYRPKYSYGRKPEDAIYKRPEVEIQKEIFSPIEDQEKIPLKPEVEIKKEILFPMKNDEKIDWKKQEVKLENEIIKTEYTLVIERILNREKSINDPIPHPEFYEMLLNPMYALKNEMMPHPEFTKNYEMVVNSKLEWNNKISVKRNYDQLRLKEMRSKLNKLTGELEEISSMASLFLKTPLIYFKNEEDPLINVLQTITQATKMTKEYLKDSTFNKPEPTNYFSNYMENHILSPYITSPPLSNLWP